MTGKINICFFAALLLSFAPIAAQTSEDLLIKIYTGELDYIVKNRVRYLERTTNADVDTAGVYSGIVSEGVSLSEYVGARSVVSSDLTFNDFIAKHRLAPEDELALFTGFASAKLADYAAYEPVTVPECAEPSFSRPGSKVKLKVSTKDPVTGGEIWTFSNNVRVLFKQSKPKGRFSFNLALRGGYAEIADLEYGTGPFLGDMLELYDVAGIRWADFKRFLETRGILIDCRVSITDMQIYGSAPSEELRTLLLALSAIAKDRKLDSDAFNYYLSRSGGHIDIDNPFADADRIMRPSYVYTPFRYAGCMSESLPERAGVYYDNQLSHIDDGMLMIVGDLDQTAVQKTLGGCLADFRTGMSYTARPFVQYKLLSGDSSRTLDMKGDGPESVNIVISGEMPVTSSVFMSLKLALTGIRNRLKTEMHGADVSVDAETEFFPTERVMINVSCLGYEESGACLGNLRSALNDIFGSGLSSDDIKTSKAVLTGDLEKLMGTPEGNIDAAAMRYLDGKDFYSGYKDKIGKIKDEDVNGLLGKLAVSPRVEIIYQR